MAAGCDQQLLEKYPIVTDTTGLHSISATASDGRYDDYIQVGAFHNEVNGDHYFMAVNRRTNFAYDDENKHNAYDVDSEFSNAGPQTVRFDFIGLTPNTCYAFVDPYAPEEASILISNASGALSYSFSIDAGDGKLIQMIEEPIASLITDRVECDTVMTIPYPIKIGNGGQLILKAETILSKNCSITVLEGGSLEILANMKMGKDAKIISYGNVTIRDTLEPVEDSWRGIECHHTVTVDTATILGINRFEIHDGQLTINSSHIECTRMGVSVLGGELQIYGTEELPTELIWNNPNHCPGEIIEPGGYMTGIAWKDGEISMDHVHLNNFTYALARNSVLPPGCYPYPPYPTAAINHAQFTNCKTGVWTNGYVQLDIRNSRFDIPKAQGTYLGGTGINCYIGRVRVDSCLFLNGYHGIELTQTLAPMKMAWPGWLPLTIKHSTFRDNVVGIYLDQSSPRIEKNKFFNNNVNIMSTHLANPNCCQNAKNLFWNGIDGGDYTSNIALAGGNIGLYNGRNDFYTCQEIDYYHLVGKSPEPLEVSKNFWAYDDPRKYDNMEQIKRADFPITCDVEVNYEVMCDAPNVFLLQWLEGQTPDPNPHPETKRFNQAVKNEMDGQYQTALDTFKTIAVEQRSDESDVFASSLDRSFFLSLAVDQDVDGLQAFFNAILAGIPQDSLRQRRQVENYIKRCHILQEEYQAAADMLCEIIDHPQDETEELLAIMDLETTYMLADSDENKAMAPVTQHAECRKPNLKAYLESRKAHQAKLMGLKLDVQQPKVPLVTPEFMLAQNYPNPFNPETTIRFGLDEAHAGKVKLTVYNIKGQRVRTLLNSTLPSGMHSVIWNGQNENGEDVSSGVYFYQLSTAKNTQTKRMLLLK